MSATSQAQAGAAPTIVILGHPVHHSVSPAMQGAAFAALGLPHRVVAVDVPPAELPAAIARFRSGEWAGGNVTIPHKRAVLALLDEVTDTAALLGAANTIINRDGRLVGDNTDAAGFTADLDLHAVDPRGAPVLVFGTGGSARAVAYALLQRGAAEVRLLGRNIAQGAQLARELHAVTGGRLINFAWTPTDLGDASHGCVLAVNCTPLGMTPNIYTTPWFQVVPFGGKPFIYDLVYNPAQTLLLRQALSHGLQCATGLGMLVQQGALAFQRWTGSAAPVAIMRAAAEAKLYA